MATLATPASVSLRERLRVLLVLGRVSNLPTVWSNCLAAWMLAGGGSWDRFSILECSATCLYTGGMFLNDAFDRDFDRQFRPERPIVSGQISAPTVWAFGWAWLGLGWLLSAALGLMPLLFSTVLVVDIVVYDALHKRVRFGPVLMASCRLLLYLLAGSAALNGIGMPVSWRALALMGYILGLSYLARGESTGKGASRWPLMFLLTPLMTAMALGHLTQTATWLALVVHVTWLVWCLRGIGAPGSWNVGRGVSGLLAGIVLVDWLAAAPPQVGFALTFAALFVLARVMQRVAPAT